MLNHFSLQRPKHCIRYLCPAGTTAGAAPSQRPRRRCSCQTMMALMTVRTLSTSPNRPLAMSTPMAPPPLLAQHDLLPAAGWVVAPPAVAALAKRGGRRRRR